MPEAKIAVKAAEVPIPKVVAENLSAKPTDENVELASSSEPTPEELAAKEAAEEEIEFNVAEALAQRDYTPW